MAAPAMRPMPDVSRWLRRDMEIPTNKAQLEMKLLDWMAEVTDYIGQNAPMQGIRPASYLVATADGVDLLRFAPTAMANAKGQILHTVFAIFLWGVNPTGYWYIRSVKFTLDKIEDAAARKAAYKQYLIDKAQDEYDSKFHAREAVFKAEQHVETWQKDIHTGDTIIAAQIERVVEWGKEEASMPENPYTPQDIALSFVGAKISHISSRAEKIEEIAKMYKRAGIATKDAKETIELAEKLKRSKKLAEYYEKIDKTKTWSERGQKVEEIIDKDEDSDNPAYDVSRTDMLIEMGIDVLADVADELIPGSGGIIKLFAGMLWEMAHSSDTKRVTKIRARVYAAFVAGFVEGMTLTSTSTMKNDKDKHYYDKGYSTGSHMPEPNSFACQISLLNYSNNYYTSGFWAGSSYQVHGLKNSAWSFPDDYKAAWSPELLGRAFLTQFQRGKYLWQD